MMPEHFLAPQAGPAAEIKNALDGNSQISQIREDKIGQSAAARAVGRANGIIQAVLRQCSGSGDSINQFNGSPWYDATNNPKGIGGNPTPPQ